MSEPSGSSNGQAIIFRARVEQVGVLGNFVIKAVIAVYGVALVALLGSVNGLIGAGCFENGWGTLAFVAMATSLVLGTLLAVRAAAKIFIKSFISIMLEMDRSNSLKMETEDIKAEEGKAEGGKAQTSPPPKLFSHLLGPNIPAGAAVVIGPFAIFFWCSVFFFAGLITFFMTAECFTSPLTLMN